MLESYSASLLPLIDWEPTASGNLRMLNDTADFYRFDATRHAEFLYACVEQVIEHDMPNEIRFIESFERFSEAIQQIVDMPAGQVEVLRGFLAQNDGALFQRAKTREFSALTEDEVAAVERAYALSFAG